MPLKCTKMKKRLLQRFNAVFMLIGSLLVADSAMGQFSTAAAYPFNASSSTFNYLSGGTSVSWLNGDDRNQQSIPIGFTFNFAGTNYTTVSACSNGWLSFANSSSTTTSNATSALSTIAPAVMPLFEDISGIYGSASYQTTGTAPNRVFTFEWKNWIWNYSSSNSPSISFQVKLYEDTRIEFLYKQESGSITSSSGGATIGIAKSSSDWQVLNNSTSSPTSSSSSFTTNILSRPATGQSYVWGQPPCLYTPVNGTTTNVLSNKATINWSDGINGAPAQGYEIVVDQNSGNPSGAGTSVTGTTYTKTGLTPGTDYYAHVRGRCSSISTSSWLHIPFTTTICVSPEVSMSNITHESALALWNSLPPAINYQYIVNTTGIPPISDLGAGNTASNSAQLSGLTPNTHYYLYMRTQCTNNEESDWEATEFTTMEECLKPDITLIKLSPTEMDATWNEVPTAVAYEYVVNSFDTPPSLGKIIYTNDVNVTIPNDDKPYYLHIRTKCISIFTSSDWATVTLREPPATNLSNVNADHKLLIMAYPNPTNSTITIDLNGLQSNRGTITLTDITGKALYVTNATTASLNIDMNHMPAGIYMIKYSNKDQNQVLKVTKQ